MNKCLALGVVVGLGGLVYWLAPILTPFVAGALVAYLADPVADRLEAQGLSRHMAVVVVFAAILLVIALVLFLVIPLLEDQIASFFDNLPAYNRWIQSTGLPWIRQHLGVRIRLGNLDQIATMLSAHWQQAGGAAASVLASLSHSGKVVLSWVMNLILVPVVIFYLLRDWDVMVRQIENLLPRPWLPTVRKLAFEVDEVLSLVFRGQFTVMLALGIVYSVGLWLVGLNLALLIGMFAGLISFIPYAGSITGLVAATLAALGQFDGFWPVAAVWLVFAVGQSLEGMWLTPWLVGNRIGLHPVAVIFAVLAGGQMFGFLGVMLALPLSAVVMVLLRHAHDLYKDSDWYGGEAAPDGRAAHADHGIEAVSGSDLRRGEVEESAIETGTGPVDGSR